MNPLTRVADGDTEATQRGGDPSHLVVQFDGTSAPLRAVLISRTPTRRGHRDSAAGLGEVDRVPARPFWSEDRIRRQRRDVAANEHRVSSAIGIAVNGDAAELSPDVAPELLEVAGIRPNRTAIRNLRWTMFVGPRAREACALKRVRFARATCSADGVHSGCSSVTTESGPCWANRRCCHARGIVHRESRRFWTRGTCTLSSAVASSAAYQRGRGTATG